MNGPKLGSSVALAAPREIALARQTHGKRQTHEKEQWCLFGMLSPFIFMIFMLISRSSSFPLLHALQVYPLQLLPGDRASVASAISSDAFT